MFKVLVEDYVASLMNLQLHEQGGYHPKHKAMCIVSRRPRIRTTQLSRFSKRDLMATLIRMENVSNISSIIYTLCRRYGTRFCPQSNLEHQDQLFSYFITNSNFQQLPGLDSAFAMSFLRCECFLNTSLNPAEESKAHSINLSSLTAS